MKKSITIFLLFSFFCLGDNQYLIYSAPLILFLLYLSEERHTISVLNYFFIFLLIYFYGFILGLINGNKFNYIINNSAGFFTLFFILTYNKAFEIIFNIKFLKIISLVIFFQVIISFLLTIFTNIDVYNTENLIVTTFLGDFKGGSSTGHFRIFTVKSIISIYFFLILFSYYFDRKIYLYSFIYLIFSFILVILLASKGMFTGYIFLLTIFFLFTRKSIFTYIFIASIFLVLLIFFIKFDLLLLITATFDRDDVANANRLQQINYLYKSGFPFGRGFGALIQSETFRSEASPYSYELSYYSYFHKIGLFLFLFIFLPLFYFIKNLYLKITQKITFINFSIILFSFLYILPSIGNPLLFHPYHTFMFIIPILIFNKNPKIDIFGKNV